MTPNLTIKGLGKRYSAVTALGSVDLEVACGDVLALLGPNGAGKSTLFGCLLGFVRPSSGQILLDGKPIVAADRKLIGYMPERVALYPHNTVRENGLFFAQLKGQTAAEFDRQLQRVCLDHAGERPVRQLSKGMLQRLGLAIALCGSPSLLILDEPFNGLDPALLDGLQAILAEERARGATLLISTHTMSAVESLATHAAVLLEGNLAAHGTLEELRFRHGESSLESIYHRIARARWGEAPAEPKSNAQGSAGASPHRAAALHFKEAA